MIHCNVCGKNQEKEEFYHRNNRIVYPCKTCKKAYYAKWRENNSNYHKAWRDANRDKTYQHIKKYRTKLRKERLRQIQIEIITNSV